LLSHRRAGVLLHPTSLPGPSANGVFGSEARRFIDRIAASGFTVWQMLPLGPVDTSRSPYQLSSVFAGNPELIDPRTQDPIHGTGSLAGPKGAARLAEFFGLNQSWLRPYALYEAIHRSCGNPWWQWPASLREREQAAVTNMWQQQQPLVRQIVREQYLFDSQWQALRDYAREQGVLMFGDLPFYVDYDSAEVWWNRDLFQLDEQGRPLAVAGVPPDYFSADGQLWGNPLYDWERLQTTDFDWWIQRMTHQLRRFDLLRIDHFRALESCWAIPADATSAREGQWEQVPGRALLNALREKLGDLPLVAEDLGVITPEVETLRDEFGLPGMLILQFAFDGSPDNPYLPQNHRENAVVYTGTHDNDTTLGWFSGLDEQAQAYVAGILDSSDMPGALIRTAYQSPAKLAVIPMQDLLGLGTDARMNVPGTSSGNWGWQFGWDEWPPEFEKHYRALGEDCGRIVSA